MKNTYESPLTSRYASKEMQALFSPDKKFKTWRRLWVALAEAEMELGLDISQDQVDELKSYQDDINYDVAQAREREVRHDVMSHVYAYGVQCPKAAGIIHLGATSCYVGDNTDLIIDYEALDLIRKRLIKLISILAEFADKYKDLPTLGFTHFQPAQPTTVGKRACLWIQDFILDLESLEDFLQRRRLRGVKGTTGTQASFLELFDGDYERVKQLDRLVAKKMGYDDVFAVTGQTYSRKFDSQLVNILAGIAQSATKFSNDIRLLQHLKEIEEPFEKNQIGSSAMAYKRNPMRSERIASLARYIIADMLNPAMTVSGQWFERLVVYPKVIEQRLMKELPFMATENIMMDAVKRGGNRQELHERIRIHSLAAGKIVKEEGGDNDLVDRIAEDPSFGISKEEILEVLRPDLYVGCAPMQVREFIDKVVGPILASGEAIDIAELSV